MSFIINTSGGSADGGPSGAVPVGAVVFDQVFAGPFTGLPQFDAETGAPDTAMTFPGGSPLSFVVPYTASYAYAIRCEVQGTGIDGDLYKMTPQLAAMGDFLFAFGSVGYTGAGDDWVPAVDCGSSLLTTGQEVGIVYAGQLPDPASTVSFRNIRVRIVDVVGN